VFGAFPLIGRLVNARRKFRVALGYPQQRPYRITHRGRLKQPAQILQQPRVHRRQRPSPTAGPPNRSPGKSQRGQIARGRSCYAQSLSRARRQQRPRNQRSEPPPPRTNGVLVHQGRDAELHIGCEPHSRLSCPTIHWSHASWNPLPYPRLARGKPDSLKFQRCLSGNNRKFAEAALRFRETAFGSMVLLRWLAERHDVRGHLPDLSR
jgi:hypothetical protein